MSTAIPGKRIDWVTASGIGDNYRRVIEWIAERDEPFSALDLGEGTGLPTNNAAYYIRKLQKNGLIKWVEDVPSKGSLRRYYERRTGWAE